MTRCSYPYRPRRRSDSAESNGHLIAPRTLTIFNKETWFRSVRIPYMLQNIVTEGLNISVTTEIHSMEDPIKMDDKTLLSPLVLL